jgi:hypothetical protein
MPMIITLNPACYTVELAYRVAWLGMSDIVGDPARTAKGATPDPT